MNPFIVIAGFIVVLAVLIYYLQSREEPDRKTPSKKPEKNVIKVKDYEAQYKAEQQKEEPVEESVKESPITEQATEENDDIAQLSGVGPKYQELLRAAGYKSIKTIAGISPENLYSILLKVNEEKEITKRPPTLRNIEEWIKSAASHSE